MAYIINDINLLAIECWLFKPLRMDIYFGEARYKIIQKINTVLKIRIWSLQNVSMSIKITDS